MGDTATYQATLNYPNEESEGSDYFIYVVEDASSTSNESRGEITVVGENDAPTAENSEVTVSEDIKYIFEDDDFGYTDVDGDELRGISIASLPTLGSLYEGLTQITG